jgi:hypothetical protein
MIMICYDPEEMGIITSGKALVYANPDPDFGQMISDLLIKYP